MTRKEYVDEVRPSLRLAISLIIFISWSNKLNLDVFDKVQNAYAITEIFINEFESQLKFEEEKS